MCDIKKRCEQQMKEELEELKMRMEQGETGDADVYESLQKELSRLKDSEVIGDTGHENKILETYVEFLNTTKAEEKHTVDATDGNEPEKEKVVETEDKKKITKTVKTEEKHTVDATDGNEPEKEKVVETEDKKNITKTVKTEEKHTADATDGNEPEKEEVIETEDNKNITETLETEEKPNADATE